MSSLDPVILSEVKKIQKAQRNPPATGDFSTIAIPIAKNSVLEAGGIGFVDRYSNEILDKFSGQITSIPSIPFVGAGGGGYYYPIGNSHANIQLPNGNYLIAYQTKATTQGWTSKTLFAIIDKDTGNVLSTVTTGSNTLTQYSTTTNTQASTMEFITCSDPNKFILLIRASANSAAGITVIGIVPISVSNNTITQYATRVDYPVSGVSTADYGTYMIDLLTFKLINDNSLMVSCPYWTGTATTQIRYYKFTNIFLGTIAVDTTTPATSFPTSSSGINSTACSIILPNNKVLMNLYSASYVFDIDVNGVLSNPVTLTVAAVPGYNPAYYILNGYLQNIAGFLKGGSYINGVLTNAVCFTLYSTIGNKATPATISDISSSGVVTLSPLVGYYEIFKEYTKLQDTKWDYTRYKDITSNRENLTIMGPIGKFLLFNIYGRKFTSDIATPITCGPHICRLSSFLLPYKNIGFINSVAPPLANVKGLLVDNINYYNNIGNTYVFELDDKRLAPYNFAPDNTQRFNYSFQLVENNTNTKKLTEVEFNELSYVKISFSGTSITGRRVFIFADGICVYKSLVTGDPKSSTIVWEGIVAKNLLIVPGVADSSTVTNFYCDLSIYGVVPV